MYQAVLALHNLGRYAVLGFALFALWRAASGLLARGGWLPSDEKARRMFPILLDVQFLLGLLLYVFLSPLTRGAFQDFGMAMKVSELRFYAVEHIFAGIVAIALAHIGSVRIRRSKVPAEKFRTMAIFYGLSLVAILSRMPWHRWIPSLGG